MLFAKGKIPPKTAPEKPEEPVGIAMVGTRRPSNNAKELCRRLVNSLRGTNAVIVSGLAQGIDSMCHEAAIEAGIPTVAVLGQGLHTPIESSRQELARRIVDSGGALLSIFPPDTPAYRGNFIARNRIISGLCKATLVVQSKAKGGALITADFCLKEGKPLFAVPGDFDCDVASGTNALLDCGKAKPIYIPDKLYMALGLPRVEGNSLKALKSQGCNLSDQALKMLRQVNGFRKNFTELQEEFDFNVPSLLAILTELEIAGLVQTEDNFQFYFNGAI